jgi:hypothetical protein
MFAATMCLAWCLSRVGSTGWIKVYSPTDDLRLSPLLEPDVHVVLV